LDIIFWEEIRFWNLVSGENGILKLMSGQLDYWGKGPNAIKDYSMNPKTIFDQIIWFTS
jgi:hypothetical protein